MTALAAASGSELRVTAVISPNLFRNAKLPSTRQMPGNQVRLLTLGFAPEPGLGLGS